MRLLKTIGSVDFTGQERAALNKLTMPCEIPRHETTISGHRANSGRGERSLTSRNSVNVIPSAHGNERRNTAGMVCRGSRKMPEAGGEGLGEECRDSL